MYDNEIHIVLDWKMKLSIECILREISSVEFTFTFLFLVDLMEMTVDSSGREKITQFCAHIFVNHLTWTRP